MASREWGSAQIAPPERTVLACSRGSIAASFERLPSSWPFTVDAFYGVLVFGRNSGAGAVNGGQLPLLGVGERMARVRLFGYGRLKPRGG
ncbi:hypothetical protein THICB1_150036 [Thiomonas arsenitoxydans]|uniref:Uncharacterized protein n=2 Tax=Thiomonas TaxID=32012 RepID=A0A238D3E1_THIDL|nr:hypothetical protein ACO3_130036 [Thiomonas arsenitoxydans]SBP87818.1 hypothetical protein THIARS_60531 [Thiomonas delicata]CQR29017.1 hypothetical protein ACO7_120037 [Thiomonas arsenitoxydans]CQR30465.1 hypothetical protein THICB1_150036 [Thiomonas arsenitoxydans]CQR35682.1 hypothetical protein THICB6_230076 [Thiomonas arsenitoxydans]